MNGGSWGQAVAPPRRSGSYVVSLATEGIDVGTATRLLIRPAVPWSRTSALFKILTDDCLSSIVLGNVIAYFNWPDQNDGPLPLAAFAALDALRHTATAVDAVSEASAKVLPSRSREYYWGRPRFFSRSSLVASAACPTTTRNTDARAAHWQPLAHRRVPRPN